MALRRERMRLGDILIKQHIITEDQLKKALELQKGTGKKIGEIIVDSGGHEATAAPYRNHYAERSYLPTMGKGRLWPFAQAHHPELRES